MQDKKLGGKRKWALMVVLALFLITFSEGQEPKKKARKKENHTQVVRDTVTTVRTIEDTLLWEQMKLQRKLDTLLENADKKR